MRLFDSIRPLFSIFCLILLTAACDVHEFPEIPETRPIQGSVRYHLHFTEFTMWEHLYEDDDVCEVGFGEKYQSIHNQGFVRYVIRAYPKSDNQRAAMEHVKEFVFIRDVADGYDCGFPLDLPPGSYTIMVWSDFIRNSGDSYFYNTDDFAEITLQGEHCGNNDYRDVFRGVAEVDLPADVIEREDIEMDVHMQRILAKYEIITTGLAEFIRKEQGLAETTKVSLDDYRAVFYYAGFMPNAYSMFTDRPVDSATGVFFESKLSRLNDDEASVGFDYVFVGENESMVTVQLAIYNRDGQQVALSVPVNVPLKRSHHTVLKGSFLKKNASGGVGISPGFNGDFNVPI